MTYPYRIMIRPHGAVLPIGMGIVEILAELSKAVCLLKLMNETVRIEMKKEEV
jgi:hypothetical protein